MSEVSKYQTFTMERLHRSLLNPAPYNPRSIDAHARKKLRESIKAGGLVDPVVWNRRTGNIVGGHQRISILDELEGGADYYLDVSVLDIDEKAEKELNVRLNNWALMGTYDMPKLEEILGEIDWKQTGFDRLDIEEMFPQADFTHLFKDEEQSVTADAAEIQRMKKEKKRFKDQGAQEDDAGFFIHLVAGDSDEITRFLKRVGLPTDDRFLDLRKFCTAIGVDLDKGE